MLHSVADVPMVCIAINKVLERGWGPIVVVINEQNEESVKQVEFHYIMSLLIKIIPGDLCTCNLLGEVILIPLLYQLIAIYKCNQTNSNTSGCLIAQGSAYCRVLERDSQTLLSPMRDSRLQEESYTRQRQVSKVLVTTRGM